MLLDLAAEGRWPPIRFVRRTSMLVLIRLKLTCSGSPRAGAAGDVLPDPAAGCGSASSGGGRVAGDTEPAPVPIAPGTPQQRRAAPLAAAGGHLQHQQVEPARGVQLTARCP